MRNAAILTVLMLLAGCASAPPEETDVAPENKVYLDDDALESFDSDLQMLSEAIYRGNEKAEKSLRAKISENARRYQRALLSAIVDDDSTDRRAVASVLLGFTGDSSVIPLLLNKLSDEDEPERVKLNAVLGLKTLGPKLRDYPKHDELAGALTRLMYSTESSAEMRRSAVGAYAQVFDAAQGDKIAPVRDRFISDPDPRVQHAAITAMGDVGSTDAVGDLIAIGLDHPDVDLRVATAIALGKIEAPEQVVPALADAANDDSPRVRRQAIDGLSRHYGAAPDLVYAAILTGLSDFEPVVRESSALAMSRVMDPRGIEPLLQATGDRTAMVRRASATSIGALLPTDRAKEAYPLVGLLADQDPGVQLAAQTSLAQITKEDFGGDQEHWRKYYYETWPELDPAKMYEGTAKPRVTSGINSSGRTSSSRRPSSSRNTNRNTRNNRNSRNSRNSSRSSRNNTRRGR